MSQCAQQSRVDPAGGAVLSWTDPQFPTPSMAGIAIERAPAGTTSYKLVQTVRPGVQHFVDTDPALADVAVQPCYRVRAYQFSIALPPAPNAWAQVVTFSPYTLSSCGSSGAPSAAPSPGSPR